MLIFPGGKGSSVVQADGLYQLNLKENCLLYTSQGEPEEGKRRRELADRIARKLDSRFLWEELKSMES